MNDPFRVLSEEEASAQGFHDCHIYGLAWNRDLFTFSLDIDYILQWHKPQRPADSYKFSVSKALMVFNTVNDIKLWMDWSKSAIDAQILSLATTGSRTTPKGGVLREYTFEFSEPDATLSLWSTGYEVVLLSEPIVSNLPSIRFP
jgi:hypothetical protein